VTAPLSSTIPGSTMGQLVDRAANARVCRRPRNKKRFPANHASRHGTKWSDAAIKTILEVVANHKIIPFGNCNRMELAIVEPLGLIPHRQCTRLKFPKRVTNEEGTVGPRCNSIARNADDSFDKERIGRQVFHHDDIAALWLMIAISMHIGDNVLTVTIVGHMDFEGTLKAPKPDASLIMSGEEAKTPTIKSSMTAEYVALGNGTGSSAVPPFEAE
jgi:hypothetical protein